MRWDGAGWEWGGPRLGGQVKWTGGRELKCSREIGVLGVGYCFRERERERGRTLVGPGLWQMM